MAMLCWTAADRDAGGGGALRFVLFSEDSAEEPRLKLANCSEREDCSYIVIPFRLYRALLKRRRSLSNPLTCSLSRWAPGSELILRRGLKSTELL